MDSFEKHIIKKLNEHNSHYSSKVWENISLEINQEDERRKLLIWPFFLSLGLLLLLGGLFNYLYNTDHQSSLYEANYPEMTKNTSLIIQENEADIGLQLLKRQDNIISIPVNKTKIAVYKKQSASIVSNEENLLPKKSYTSPVLDNLIPKRSQVSIGKIASTTIVPIEFGNRKKKKSRLTKICPKFGDDRPRANLTIYTGPSQVNKSLVAKTYEAQPYEIARNNMESDWISFSAGLRFDYRFYKNLYLSGGLEYDQITEKLEFDDISEQRIQTIITIDTFIVGIDTSIVSDTSRVVVQGVRNVKHFNSFKSYNIPILVGFKYNISPKISIGINGGASFILFNEHSGKILNDQFTIANYDSNGTSNFQPYKTDLGIALNANLNFNYAINQKWSWFAEGGFKYYLDPISTDSYTLNQKYSLTKLKFGANFNF